MPAVPLYDAPRALRRGLHAWPLRAADARRDHGGGARVGRALAARRAARVLRLGGETVDPSESVDPGAVEEESAGGRRFSTLDIRYVQVCYSPGGIAARHCSRPAAAARDGRGWRRGDQATAARPTYIRRGPSSSSMPGVDAVRPRRRRLRGAARGRRFARTVVDGGAETRGGARGRGSAR